MQEVFYEESARIQNEHSANRRYNTIRLFSIFSYVGCGLWLFLCINFYTLSGYWLLDLLFVLVPAILFLVSGIILGRLKNKFYVDYDYTFVTGSIRISKVIKNIKRKFLIKFDVKDIEKLGKYGSTTFFKYEQMAGINKMIMTSNDTPSGDKDFYYITLNHGGEKKLLILEASEMFIINIIKFSNKGILDEEFIKELSKAKN